MEYLTERERSLIGSTPPITKKAFEPLWLMRPIGNVSNAYIMACRAIRFGANFDGSPVTLEILLDKWKNYLEYKRLSLTEEKYIQQLENWIEKEGYHSTYDTSELQEKTKVYIEPKNDRRPSRHRGEPETFGDDL